MSKNENPPSLPGTPEDFDLFATPADTHLAEELEKGTFEWTNKYTKALGVLTLAVGLLSLCAWYGHHSATNGAAASAGSLRSAFARFAGASGGGTGSGTGSGAGGSGFGGFSGGGGGFGTRVTGSIASVSGSTVTITLTDPTQASSLKAGDSARITDTGAAGAQGGFAGGATPGASASPSASPRPSKPHTGSSSSGTGNSGSGTGTAAGGAGAAGGPGAGRGGGLFNNPDLTACLTKAGITMTPGSRPNFQDPATAAAIQSCMKSLGITFGGGAGGGFGGGRTAGGAGAGAAGSGAAGGTTTP